MAKDRRPYFTMTNEYPDHRKIRGLSDKAFRLHVTLIAYCNKDKSDGRFGDHDLNSKGRAAGKELIAAGLVNVLGGGEYELHDYLSHQNSREEIEKLISERKAAGSNGGEKSAHTRWHVKRGIKDPDCDYCQRLIA